MRSRIQGGIEMNYVNVGYDSTNYYAIATQNGYILIDVGMPGTTKKLVYSLNKNGINVKDISHLIVTHFHPDHCGIVQDLQQIGIELIISDMQSTFIESANKYLKKLTEFKEIIVNPKNIIIENDKNVLFNSFGIPGYFIYTPGHSEDSISIVIEGLGVFIGDLPLLDYSNLEAEKKIEQSWDCIKKTGEKKIFPAHVNSFEL